VPTRIKCVCFISVWTRATTLLLIETYRQHKFKNPTLRKKEVWGRIAADMNLTAGKDGSLFTATACDKKWHNMEGRFKAKRDKKSKTGRAGERQWLYYDLMEEVIGMSAAVRAVSEVSSVLSSKPQTKSVTAPPSSDEENENAQSTSAVTRKNSEPAAEKQREDNMYTTVKVWSAGGAEEFPGGDHAASAATGAADGATQCRAGMHGKYDAVMG